ELTASFDGPWARRGPAPVPVIRRAQRRGEPVPAADPLRPYLRRPLPIIGELEELTDLPTLTFVEDQCARVEPQIGSRRQVQLEEPVPPLGHRAHRLRPARRQLRHPPHQVRQLATPPYDTRDPARPIHPTLTP